MSLDPDAPDLPRLRDALERLGYLGEAVHDALGARLGPAHLRKDHPLYLRRLERGNPLHTAIRLFGLAQVVGEADAAEALAPAGVAGLVEAGLLERGPEGVRARVDLGVHRGVLLAHDRFDPRLGPHLKPDHVLGSSPASVLLDNLTVRLPRDTALDLGCGGGVQAFLAARHCRQVVAADRNPRALLFLRLNARLNGISNVEPVEGNLFAPVAQRRFGLVVSNPPYVISPESRFLFRDSGRSGDALCEEVVHRVSDHLHEGGFATVLCNWALRRGEEWSAPLVRWIEGSGCDAWLLRSDVKDPLSYAAVWNRDRGDAYGEALDRWMKFYAEAGIEGIGLGAVILRRRAGGSTWVRADVLPRDPDTPCHDQIVRVFDAADFLAGLRNHTDLLAQRFRLVEGHRLDQGLRLNEGRFAIETSEIWLEDGFRFRGGVDPVTVRLLESCDGRTPVLDIIDELAASIGADRGRLTEVVAEAVRRMVAFGFLVPSTAETTGPREAQPPGTGPGPDPGLAPG
jgi:SAM-dependent methyltransferase